VVTISALIYTHMVRGGSGKSGSGRSGRGKIFRNGAGTRNMEKDDQLFVRKTADT
jgi:hypothetical protein